MRKFPVKLGGHSNACQCVGCAVIAALVADSRVRSSTAQARSVGNAFGEILAEMSAPSIRRKFVTKILIAFTEGIQEKLPD